MVWFAARPIAQARAAVLLAALPTGEEHVRRLIEIAITGETSLVNGEAVRFQDAVVRLQDRISESHPDGLTMLDPFSGRGIIPLEAARYGIDAVGIDLAPLAVLASRLLAEYALDDWTGERELPTEWRVSHELTNDRKKLIGDVESFLGQVNSRLRNLAVRLYPANGDGSLPWGYLWAVTIPCDECSRRFPILGSSVLRHPGERTGDFGQWIRIIKTQSGFTSTVESGVPPQDSHTFVKVSGQRGRVARCPFCRRVHSLDVVKQKGFAGEYEDAILAVAENNYGNGPSKIYRDLRQDEREAAERALVAEVESVGSLSAVPDEPIPEGNNHTVRASAYGYRSYGSLMTRRQALQFALNAQAIRDVRSSAIQAGVSPRYANALAAFGGATLGRRVKYSTRGVSLQTYGSASGQTNNGVKVNHIYADQSKVAHAFDFFEVGIGEGPGSWASLAKWEVRALDKAMDWPTPANPSRLRAGSATALPIRDSSIDVVVTDPPYYNMIDYSDASDLIYVWVRRALFDAEPDLFGPTAPPLQPKADEIIVKNGGTEDEHRTADFYHKQLAEAFSEMRRVLKPGGGLTVIFGHHDPEAWIRLLTALHQAGFVVTAAWPSRTESANTGVASVKVTVSIVCRVAVGDRPTGLVADVDREVRRAVESRVAQWNQQGLAQPDQNMAAYGPAMEAFGAHSRVVFPSGEEVDIERYLILARTVVREQLSMKVDEHPLDAFDAATRLAIYWLRYYGQEALPKGESRYNAQTEGVRLEEVRAIFKESRKGFTLSVEPIPIEADSATPMYLLVLGLAHTWREQAAEGVAQLLADASQLGILESPTDARLWAIIGDLPEYVSAGQPLATALAAITRSKNQLTALAYQREPSPDGGEQSALDLGVPR